MGEVCEVPVHAAVVNLVDIASGVAMRKNGAGHACTPQSLGALKSCLSELPVRGMYADQGKAEVKMPATVSENKCRLALSAMHR